VENWAVSFSKLKKERHGLNWKTDRWPGEDSDSRTRKLPLIPLDSRYSAAFLQLAFIRILHSTPREIRGKGERNETRARNTRKNRRETEGK
jgi:hypothetical protein